MSEEALREVETSKSQEIGRRALPKRKQKEAKQAADKRHSAPDPINCPMEVIAVTNW